MIRSRPCWERTRTPGTPQSLQSLALTFMTCCGFGSTPLMAAASRGHTRCVVVLLAASQRAGIPIALDTQASEKNLHSPRCTALYLAALRGHTEVCAQQAHPCIADLSADRDPRSTHRVL